MSVRILTERMKYDTPGRRRLGQLDKGPTELFGELKKAVPGMSLDVSTVSRWRSGDIRPEAFWRAAMKKVWGIAESDWLLPDELVALRGKGAA
jgi:hypothetical protein